MTVAEHAAAAGLTGLEFLSGIPGTIGGAVAMNAGAYGGESAHVLDWAEIVTRSGELRRRMTAADLAFAYRHAALPPGARGHARPAARAARRAGGDRRAHGGDPRQPRGHRSRSAPAPAVPPSATRRA